MGPVSYLILLPSLYATLMRAYMYMLTHLESIGGVRDIFGHTHPFVV